MKPAWAVSVLGIALCLWTSLCQADDPNPAVGPSTEERFPPLIIPEGFESTLFACDPLVEYPSVIALGPRPSTLFVAHDYMTGLGVEIVRRDEIRLLADTDDDGYADKSTVYAGEFNSIQGLAYYNDTVFVMHAPLLTALQDTDGDGVADERDELLDGLGLPPEENSNRLHCANGVVAGHDGWLYLALGDRGCDVERPEGDRFLFQQGGILRCRFDGTDLHAFSTGLRNIYDVALDDELNVFVRDNENDGGIYMIRVCHCFHGSNHGYPYHYYERPDEAMPPLADLGRGSSAGGTSYMETAFPGEYRKSLYFCEWGRAVVRYPLRISDSSFEPMTEHDFAAGAADDTYGFKPTDLVVDYDGSLLISDWCDGQRPKRGRGRIYRISAKAAKDARPSASGAPLEEETIADLIGQLDSASYHARAAAQLEISNRGDSAIGNVRAALADKRLDVHGRMHAVWILAQSQQESVIEELFELAESDEDPQVCVQAIRAIGDLTDPVLVKDRLNAGRGERKHSIRLASIAAENDDPRVLLATLTALARHHWVDIPIWLSEVLPENPDPAIEHAAMMALRRCENWPAVLALLDATESSAASTLRLVALRAIAEQEDAVIVDGLLSRLRSEQCASRRQEYADLLSRVHHQPGEWVYWGFRPGPRPAHTETWERTEAIADSLNQLLADVDFSVRAFVLKRLLREKVPLNVDTLAGWLQEETNADRVSAIVDALKTIPGEESRPLLRSVVVEQHRAERNRLEAFAAWIEPDEEPQQKQLLDLTTQVEDGPVLAAVINELGLHSVSEADDWLFSKLNSNEAEVRAASVRALAKHQQADLAKRLNSLLDDPDLSVQQEAVIATGRLNAKQHADDVLALLSKSDVSLRGLCLNTLEQLGDERAAAAAVDALREPDLQLPALAYLEAFGDVNQLAEVVAVAESNLSSDIQQASVKTLSSWLDRSPADSGHPDDILQAVANIQGNSGVLLRWSVSAPIQPDTLDETIDRLRKPRSQLALGTPNATRFSQQIAGGINAEFRLPAAEDESSGVAWLASTHVAIDEGTDVEFLAAANGKLRVWLNGKQILKRDKRAAYRPDSERFDGQLKTGLNHILLMVADASGQPRFHLRFRRRSSQAQHEKLIRQALNSGGNANRGKEVFQNAEKSLCLKCHRLGPIGGKVGPDLAGIGRRFSKIHLIESLLEPSRTVAPSFGTSLLALSNGQVLAGVVLDEDESTVTIGDKDGKTHSIDKSEVEERRLQSLSTMPDGLEKRLTEREFIDLIAFLVSQKE